MVLSYRRDSKRMFPLVFSILFILAIPIILSSLLSCRVTVQGEPYGPGSRPTHLSRIEGSWFVNCNNLTGRLEFHWTGNAWTGRIWFDVVPRWEELTDVFIDPRTGQVQFVRYGNPPQQYYGTLSGDRIEGTFGPPGGSLSFPWAAWRH